MPEKKVQIRKAQGFIPGPFHAYTLVELLATLAMLAIVLAAMVGLSRHVRSSSASDLTKDILRRLDHAMQQYIDEHPNGSPDIPELLPAHPPASERQLAVRAQVNNREVVRILKAAGLFPLEQFDDLSISYYDGLTVRDAWGSQIVFMDRMQPSIGMSAKGWFFFSAGPDRSYITKSDNLYSYELPGGDR